jgi:capping protein (actin filament) muscle Z-line, beta
VRCFVDLITIVDAQVEQTSSLTDSKTHFSNIGRMIEDLETDMRSNLNELYILKTREIVNSIRSNKTGPQHQAAHINMLSQAIKLHGQNRTIDSEN